MSSQHPARFPQIEAALENDTTLKNADFSGMDLKNAELAGLRGDFLKFDRCNMELASLTRVKLTDCDFKAAVLDGADCSEAMFWQCSFVGGRLQRADFTNSDATLNFFRNSDLSDAVFERASLNDSSFHGARLVNAVFDGAQCEKVDFFKADLTGASLKNANLKGADFTLARLCGADFTGADLSDAILEDADTTDALF